jgi:hypothetical protein
MMAAREDHYVTNGDNEQEEARPSKAEETIHGGRPLEDSPVIPGGATADTTKNVAEPGDDPAGD